MHAMNPPHLIDRLVKARNSLGLSQEEAAGRARLGASGRQILSEIENNRRAVKAAELAALAKVYLRPFDHFLHEDEPEEPVVLWRQVGSPAVRAKFIACCEAYAVLERLCEQRPLVRFSPRDIARERLVPRPGQRNYEEAARLAEECRDRRCDFPARMIEDILSSHFGVNVVYLREEGFSAACTVGSFGAAVLIRADEVPWRRAFGMAHELFHLLTWDITYKGEGSKDVGENADEDMEKLANSFAAAFLMPESQVRSFIGPRIESTGKLLYPDLVAIARVFNVSLQAAMWRLVNLGYLARNQVDKLLESDGFEKGRCVRDAEDYPPPICPSARFVDLGVRAMHMARLSRAKFAGYLGIALGELDYFLAQLGYSDEEEAAIEMPPS